jgi:flagellar biosynthesis protein FlhF
MIVKKFQAQTETEAIMKARAELGPQAVVLNVKTIKQRGIMKLFKKDCVEITAALEEKEFAQEINDKKPSVDKNPHIDLRVSDKTESKPDSVEIERKLDNISELLKTQMKDNVQKEAAPAVKSDDKKTENIAEQEEADPRQAAMNNNIKTLKLVYNKLIDNEVDEKIANTLVNEIESSLKRESNVDSILAGIYQKIILKLGEPDIITLGDKKKVVFFVGPTGVGKTTTIAKIA